MMIYIEKGHAMGASLTFRPDDVKVVKDPSQLPEVIRGYQVHITTEDDAEIILQGRAEEIVALIDFLRGARIEVIKQHNAEASE